MMVGLRSQELWAFLGLSDVVCEQLPRASLVEKGTFEWAGTSLQVSCPPYYFWRLPFCPTNLREKPLYGVSIDKLSQAPAKPIGNCSANGGWAMLRLGASQCIESLRLHGQFYHACQGVSVWLGPLDELAAAAEPTDVQFLMSLREILRVCCPCCKNPTGSSLCNDHLLVLLKCQEVPSQMCALVPASMEAREAAQVWSFCNCIIAGAQREVRRHAVGDKVTYSNLNGPRPPAWCDSLTAMADRLRRRQARCMACRSKEPVAMTAAVVQVVLGSMRCLKCLLNRRDVPPLAAEAHLTLKDRLKARMHLEALRVMDWAFHILGHPVVDLQLCRVQH